MEFPSGLRWDLERRTVPLEEAPRAIIEEFRKIEKKLRERSLSTLKEMTINARDIEALKEAIKSKKIARVCWCGKIECAERIREESGGEIRGYRVDIEENPEYTCVICGKEAEKVVYVAKAY